MKILITGGAGYIGSHTALLFRESGHDVVVYDNLFRGHRAATGECQLVQGDLADIELLTSTLADGFDAVIHFAGLTYVGESVAEPDRYYQTNFAGTLNLLSAMRRTAVSKIVFSSTAAVYGAPIRVPIAESDPTIPINPYGRSKLAVEWLLADHAQAYGLAYAALRYFNAAGARLDGQLGEDHEPETHLIPLVLQVALGRRSHIDVFGDDYPTDDGTCIRDYVHVEDLASAHLLAVQALQPGATLIYNIGTGRGYSVRQVINACEQATGMHIESRICPRRSGDPPVLVASSDKIQRELRWQPRSSDLETIVGTAWRWHQSHPHGYNQALQPRGMPLAM